MTKKTKVIAGSFNNDPAPISQFLVNRYGKESPGAAHAITAFVAIYNYTVPQMPGRFTPDELRLLIQVQTGEVLNPETMPSAREWVARIRDASSTGRIEPDLVDDLVDKALTTPPAEIFFWRDEIGLLLESKGDVEKFVKKWS